MSNNGSKNEGNGHKKVGNGGVFGTPLAKRHTSSGKFDEPIADKKPTPEKNERPERVHEQAHEQVHEHGHEHGHEREHGGAHEGEHEHEHGHDKPEGSKAGESAAEKAAAMREKIRRRADEANAKAATDGVARMDLFHPGDVGKMETTGRHGKSFAPGEGSVMIKGRNIGAGRSEPDWSKDQLKAIKEATSEILEVMDVKESRVSKPDAEGKFVTRDEDEGTIVALEAAYLSNMHPSAYKLGAGPMKYGSTGGPGIYVDVVVIAKDESWMLNQVTSGNVVVDGVKEEILKKPAKMGNKRRIGHDFARVGLPKYSFGPTFNTLQSKFPGVLSEIKQTPGYYWLNASWGVSTMKGTFAYLGDDGEVHKTQVLSDIMMLNRGRSSLATATVAISISFKATRNGEDWVPIVETAGLSVKLHNAVQHDAVDYHGPEQTGAGGMFLSKSMVSTLKPVKASATLGNSAISNMSSPKGLFSNIGKSHDTPTAAAVAPDDAM